MIKKVFILICSATFTVSAFAQDATDSSDVPEIESLQQNRGYGQYKLKRYFVGGTFIAGFGDGGGAFGVNPSMGYSVSRYVDVGVALNAVYNYQKYYTGEKQHTWNLGVAPFARFYPIPFLFFDASFEYNYVNSRYFYSDGTSDRQHWNVPSLIGSVGYAQRVYGQSYFFISVGMDFLTNINSPYREQYYDSNGVLRSKAQPVIRTGFGINLW